IPTLNEAGDVAFAAAVSGGKTVEGIFATVGRRLRAVAVAGSAAPGIASGTFASLDAPALNDRGDVAFLATVRRGRESVEAIYLASGATLSKVVAQGAPAPGGGIFSHFGLWPALSASGAVGFTASVDRGTAEVAAFVSGATGLVRLGAVGDALPGGGTLSSFGLYPALALSPSGGATFATAPSASGGGVEGIFLVPPARAR